jgi:hypothetical protein
MGDSLVALAGTALLIIAGRQSPRRWFERQGPAIKLALCLLLLYAIIVFGVYGYGYDAQQFIYNQF